MILFWKLIAHAKGWREAIDEDQTPPLLVVFHQRHGIHLIGADAWRLAATYRS